MTSNLSGDQLPGSRDLDLDHTQQNLRLVPAPLKDRLKTESESLPPRPWKTVAEVVEYLGGRGLIESARSSETASEVGPLIEMPARELIQLYRKLQNQAVIEEANGILMGFYGVDADAAVQLLRRWSEEQNIVLKVLAHILVDEVAREPGQQVTPPDLIQQWIERTQTSPGR